MSKIREQGDNLGAQNHQDCQAWVEEGKVESLRENKLKMKKSFFPAGCQVPEAGRHVTQAPVWGDETGDHEREASPKPPAPEDLHISS